MGTQKALILKKPGSGFSISGVSSNPPDVDQWKMGSKHGEKPRIRTEIGSLYHSASRKLERKRMLFQDRELQELENQPKSNKTKPRFSIYVPPNLFK